MAPTPGVDIFTVGSTTSLATYGSYGSTPRKTLRRLTDADGTVTWQRKVTRSLGAYDLDGSVEDVISQLRHTSKGLIEPKMSGDYDYGYGGDDRIFTLEISGWVEDVFEDEIDAALAETARIAAEKKAAERERAERELARIRTEFPDLA